jgi:hypothetical protein
MDTQGKYYLGRLYDLQKGQLGAEPLLYDPADLTTHAVVVGMTGSGKTGLCIDLLEEAALNGVPALMIDPKGDITNTLLHFPNLLPADFQPWINVDEARREGKTPEQAAEEAASLWRSGLEKWGIDAERLRSLRDAAHFTVYTPGSSSGIPVSILASLKAPPIPWEENRELLREKISTTVIALLGLVGMEDIDPVRSREHILLANIFENAWSQAKDLDLGELIMQTQTPPFQKLGVFDVNTFFPQKDRFDLAMTLNNILAAPAFEAWLEGQPLDVADLLYGKDGRPRHSVFYIAHLSDAERMFFVTLLFSAVEAWMRAQSGTTSLRSILYFDEIFGYLPPVSNPPSKEIMLRMLKQARAFGVGLALVTQNPVDVDYKALSNAGSWFIGKLQTDQDKQRLLDGLQGAMAGDLDRGAYDRLISSLGKRVFLLHNVHAAPGSAAKVFQTRWAMNYLAGPLTRTQIPALNQLAGATPALDAASALPKAPAQAVMAEEQAHFQAVPVSPQASTSAQSGLPGSGTRPTLPGGVSEYFVPNNLTLSQAFKAAGRSYTGDVGGLGLLYRPAALAQAQVRFLNRKYNLDYEMYHTVLVNEPDRRGHVRWEEYSSTRIDPASIEKQPAPQARFLPLEAPFTDAKIMNEMGKDFLDWAYRSSEATVRANETLKVYAGPEVSSAEFHRLCSEAAREQRDAEIKKATGSYDSKLDKIRERLAREQRELAGDEEELGSRKLEELSTHAENVLNLFSGRKSSRRLSSSLSKRRMTQQAKADVEESVDAIKDFQKQIADLEAEKAQALEEIQARWGDVANAITEIPVQPYKKDVYIDLFGVAWVPFHLARVGEEIIELPGYGAE